MNPDSPQNPQEKLEASLTSLLLGELPHDEAAALHQQLAQDPELSKLYERLKETISVVRETMHSPADSTSEDAAPLKLSEDRREKLLAHFKTVAPKEFAEPKRRWRPSILEVAVAAAIVALLASLALPALAPAKMKSTRIRELALQRSAALNETGSSATPADASTVAPSSQASAGPTFEPNGAPAVRDPSGQTEGPAKHDTEHAAPNIALPLDDGPMLPSQAAQHSPHRESDTHKAVPESYRKPGDAYFALRKPPTQPNGKPPMAGIALPDAGQPADKGASGTPSVVPSLQSGRGGEWKDATPDSEMKGFSLLGPTATPSAEFFNDDISARHAGQIAANKSPSSSAATSSGSKAIGQFGTGLTNTPEKPNQPPREGGNNFVGRYAYQAAPSTQNLNLDFADKLAESQKSSDLDSKNSVLFGATHKTAPPNVELLGDIPAAGFALNSQSESETASAVTRGRSTSDLAKAIPSNSWGISAGGTSPVQNYGWITTTNSIAANGTSASPQWYYDTDHFVEMPAPTAPAPSAMPAVTPKTLAPKLRTATAQQNITEVVSEWANPVKRELLPPPSPYASTNYVSTVVVGGLDGGTADSSMSAEGLRLKQLSQQLPAPTNRAAADANQQRAKVYVQYGKQLYELGKYDEAENKLQQALRNNPNDRNALYYLSLVADAKATQADKAGSIAGKDIAQPKPTAPPLIPQPEVQTGDNGFSTFSLNVSDVSFKLAGASLEKGQMPDPGTVRSEEFINAFDYRDPEPAAGVPVAFAWERAQYPFAQNRDLLRLSLKTAALGRQPGKPLNLVLLLDNSGSMERADRVRIIHEALRVLASQLQPQDKLSIVVFARTARLWVDGAAGDQAGKVVEQITGLTPEGGTNLEEAMNLAYQTALRHYLANGVNRVVLLTDGAANLGEVEPDSLKAKVETYRKQGVALDCFGIGWEGFNDDLLEALSRNGDGRYGFINSPEEATTEFASQLAGALHVAASDVKVQIEFNPKRATAWRQIGYAKHQLTKEQFRDNTVDAAEIGAAESGNALYTVQVNPAGEGPIATVRARFKVPGTSDYREHEWAVPYTGNAAALDQASPAMRLAATASAFSEWLAASPYAGEVSPDALLRHLTGIPEQYGADARPKKLEWMIRQAKSLSGK